MTLRQYFPISILALILLIAVVHFFHAPVPIMPLAIILLAGETLMGFQVEDGKVPRLLRDLFTVTKARR